jgi:hypothetical protein
MGCVCQRKKNGGNVKEAAHGINRGQLPSPGLPSA